MASCLSFKKKKTTLYAEYARTLCNHSHRAWLKIHFETAHVDLSPTWTFLKTTPSIP